MAGQSPLRRWKPFFAAFGLVDAAIEAAGPALCRDDFRSARSYVVEQLCGVPARDDGGKAEKLCLLLDDFMAESLLTLQAVPARVVPRVLASSSTDLTEAIGALRCHQSERVRRLASDVIRGWSVAVEEDISRMKELQVQGERRAKVEEERTLPKSKKTPPSEEEEKMEATGHQAQAPGGLPGGGGRQASEEDPGDPGAQEAGAQAAEEDVPDPTRAEPGEVRCCQALFRLVV